MKETKEPTTRASATKNISSLYKFFARNSNGKIDYNSVPDLFVKLINRITGNHFVVDERNREVYTKVACYVMRDAAGAKELGINLLKGLLVQGPIGCGKTDLMGALKVVCYEVYRNDKEYQMYPQLRWKGNHTSCMDIQIEVQDDNTKLIKEIGMRKATVFLDDIGVESKFLHYGTPKDIIEELLMLRYEQFKNGYVTHATTNLIADQLKEKYSPRVTSRMREMFNFIQYPRESIEGEFDFRK